MKIARILILLSVIAFIGKLNAQEDKPFFYYGIYAGYNYNIHNPDFKYIGDCVNCGEFHEAGSGSGFSIGGLFEYPLNDKFTPYFRIGYSVLNGSFSQTEKIGNTEVRDVNNNTVDIVDAIAEYSLESSVSAFAFEPGIYYTIVENWRASLGLNFSILMNKSMTQQEELIKPDNVVYNETGQLTRNVYDDIEIPDYNALQVFLPIGTGYDFPLGKYSRISPEIKYYIPFTNVGDVDWKISYLQIGASARFAVLPKKELPVIERQIFERDTAVITELGLERPEIKLLSSRETSTREVLDDKIIVTKTTVEKYERLVPKTSRLEPDLLVRGITDDGEIQDNPQIVIEEFETTESFPLLHYVFFDEGNSELTNTNMQLLTREQALTFEPNNLPENTMDIYRNMLNVVAYRFKNTKRGDITITGTNSNQGVEKNNLQLSAARANSIKDYFINVWEIPEFRIKTQSRNLPVNFANINKPEGIAENQRAEITSSDISIIAPLVLEQIEKVANPPVIEFIPSVVHDSKITYWTLSARQDGDALRKYSGEEIENIRWNIEESPIPATETPIDISFSVNDELGQKESITKKMSISQITIREKRFELRDDKIIERFALILFDYDQATIKSEHMETLNDIKKRIKPDSEVIISGFADDTGDPEYNRNLAARRTTEVQKILNVSDNNLTVKNIGSDRLLYENNSPEGRSYCRTVTIEIETPVK